MLGSQGGRFEEHQLAPVLKFIDFGLAKVGEPDELPNVFRSAMAVLALITGAYGVTFENESTYNDVKTLATEILPTGNGAKYPALCPDLRDLLALCLASEPEQQPSLEYLLNAAQYGCSRTPKDYIPYDFRESDEHINRVLNFVIYDADTNSSDSVPKDVLIPKRPLRRRAGVAELRPERTRRPAR